MTYFKIYVVESLLTILLIIVFSFDIIRNTWRPASRAKTKLTRSDAVDIPDESQQHINLREAMKSSVSRIFSNSNRREIGKGVVGRALNRKYVSERMNTLVNEQLDEMHDHR